MPLTKVPFSMITGEVANILNFGADPSGLTNSSAAIQAALNSGANAIYLPEGTYLIQTALQPKTTQMIFGDGINTSVLKAGTAGMTVIDFPSGAYSNVVMRDFTIDGDSTASRGISMIASGQGAISNCEFHNVSISSCTLYQMYLSQTTYCVVDRCSMDAAGVGDYGLFLNDCFSSEIKNCILHNGSEASLFVAEGSQLLFSKTICFNESANTSPALCIIDGGHAHSFVDCEFEPQGASNVTNEVVLRDTFVGNNCTDNSFTRCRFIGGDATKTNCVSIGTSGSVYKTRFTECGFIKPTSTNSINLTNQSETSFARCYDLVVYDTPAYQPLTVTNTSGNAFYMESLTGVFNAVLPPSDTGASLGNALTRFNKVHVVQVAFLDGSRFLTVGAGSPEGAVSSSVGSLFSRTDGGSGTTLYVKEAGTGNTGWAAK